ncbi:MAG: hypothetical protein ACI31R_00370 [Bacilli bacterium]
MKRIKILLLITTLFLLTGCSNTLKCTIETSNYNSSIKINFKDDKPTKYKYKDEMKFSADSADTEIYYHSKYEEYNTLISEKHAYLRNKPDNVTLKITYDFSKDKSEGEDKLLINRDDTIKTATQKIESSGYKCK